MQSFASFVLNEKYVNLIGDKSHDQRRKYADQVWDLLQGAYASIGGIKGDGFKTKEDMIKTLPFWKLFVQKGKVRVVMIYKDTGGRKSVALATDRSKVAKEALSDIFKSSFDKGYGELSGAALAFAIRSVGPDIIADIAMDVKNVSKTIGKEITPATDETVAKLSDDDKLIYKRYKKLLGHGFYTRELGGHPHLKVILGVPGFKIK